MQELYYSFDEQTSRVSFLRVNEWKKDETIIWNNILKKIDIFKISDAWFHDDTTLLNFWLCTQFSLYIVQYNSIPTN